MTTLAETRLHERAATLAVHQIGMRTWRVASATKPAVEYIVKGAAGEPFEALCCNCEGGRGRCGHKTAVALRLNIPIPGPAARRRPATQTPTSSSLVGDPAAVLGAAAGSTEGADDTTGDAMPQDAAMPATIEVYAPTTGNVWAEDHDGEITLRVKVPGKCRAAVIRLADEMRAGGKGKTVQLVTVLTNGDNGQRPQSNFTAPNI